MLRCLVLLDPCDEAFRVHVDQLLFFHQTFDHFDVLSHRSVMTDDNPTRHSPRVETRALRVVEPFDDDLLIVDEKKRLLLEP